MKNKLALGGITIALLLSFVGLSNAQPASSMECKPLSLSAGVIEGLHKERIIFRGVSNRGHVTIIHLNKDTGTWSANVILPTNINQLCMVDAGTTGEITDTTFMPEKVEK